MTLILRHFSTAADSALLCPDEITPAIDSQLKDQTKIPSSPLLSLSDRSPFISTTWLSRLSHSSTQSPRLVLLPLDFKGKNSGMSLLNQTCVI